MAHDGKEIGLFLCGTKSEKYQAREVKYLNLSDKTGIEELLEPLVETLSDLEASEFKQFDQTDDKSTKRQKVCD